MRPSIVVDASALTAVVLATASQTLVSRLRASVPAAPELIDVEVTHAVRRQRRLGSIAAASAERAMRQLLHSPVTRVPHRALIFRAWQLRDSMTAYDAVYVALAEQLAVPLITCDSRLAGSHGHEADIELYPPG